MDFTSVEIGGMEQREGENEKHDIPDLPPEFCRYRDEGCEYARSCLRCPFPQCLYDEPRGRQRWMKGLRNREINRLFSDGRKIKELAQMFGLSHRTIQRALKDNKKQVYPDPDADDRQPVNVGEQRE
jgi:hypothetical protein